VIYLPLLMGLLVVNRQPFVPLPGAVADAAATPVTLAESAAPVAPVDDRLP